MKSVEKTIRRLRGVRPSLRYKATWIDSYVLASYVAIKVKYPMLELTKDTQMMVEMMVQDEISKK